MMRFVMIVAVLLVVGEASLHAAPPRRYRQMPSQWTMAQRPWAQTQEMASRAETLPAPTLTESTPSVTTNEPARATTSVTAPTVLPAPTPTTQTPSAKPVVREGDDALPEVNAARAQRGLPPYQPDPLLNQAARAAAQQRAARGIAGHLPESDFRYVPSGATASSAGCAAWEPSWGWGSCCTYDHYTYAGAAWAMGADGRRYMHLFVR